MNRARARNDGPQVRALVVACLALLISCRAEAPTPNYDTLGAPDAVVDAVPPTPDAAVDVPTPDAVSDADTVAAPDATADSTSVDTVADAAADTTGPPDGAVVETTGSVADLALTGGTVVGEGVRTVLITGTTITAVLPPEAPFEASSTVDVAGKWLVPSFIDSHVHILYRPGPTSLARGGLGAVVDHAAPQAIFADTFDVDGAGVALQVLAAGPMVTPLNGYPTQSWGSNGYGLECADLPAVEAAIDSLASQGAQLIKVPVGIGPGFELPVLSGLVARAHQLNLPVSTHATSDNAASDAAEAGCDVLAHTPTQALSPATVDAWASRAVISTLAAFGGSTTTQGNLIALQEAGATVLYGTDYGNTSYAGIDPAEINLLESAGLTPEAILASGTSSPAQFWGLDDLGAIAPDKRANILVLSADPLADPSALSNAEQVYLSGVPLL